MTTTESSKSIIRFATVPERPQPWEPCSCREGHGGGRRLPVLVQSGGRVPPTPLTRWGVCTYTEGEGAKGKKTVMMMSPRHAANRGRSSAVFCRGCGFAAWGAPSPIEAGEPLPACTGPCPILVPPGEPRPPQKSSNAHVFQERRGGSSSLIS